MQKNSKEDTKNRKMGKQGKQYQRKAAFTKNSPKFWPVSGAALRVAANGQPHG